MREILSDRCGLNNAALADNLSRMSVSDLVGLSEIADLAGGRPRQTVYNWTHRPDFPKPIHELEAGRFWNREQVESWISEHPFAAVVAAESESW